METCGNPFYSILESKKIKIIVIDSIEADLPNTGIKEFDDIWGWGYRVSCSAVTKDFIDNTVLILKNRLALKGRFDNLISLYQLKTIEDVIFITRNIERNYYYTREPAGIVKWIGVCTSIPLMDNFINEFSQELFNKLLNLCRKGGEYNMLDFSIDEDAINLEIQKRITK